MPCNAATSPKAPPAKARRAGYGLCIDSYVQPVEARCAIGSTTIAPLVACIGTAGRRVDARSDSLLTMLAGRVLDDIHDMLG